MTNDCNPFHRASRQPRRLYIFGAGGFGREIAWLAEQTWGSAVELVFLVDRPEYLQGPVNDLPVRLLAEIEAEPDTPFVAAIGDAALRRKAALGCAAAGLVPMTLVHPRAEISRWVELGQGTLICAGVSITTNIVIGAHVHINLDCTIGHDVAIGEYSTLSPGVHVSGNVAIGRDVFIGTGASIINGRADAPLLIGDGAVIAAGACVTQSVEAGALVAGVPAVRKR